MFFIIFKIAFIHASIVICHFATSMCKIIQPVAFIHASIIVYVFSLPMFFIMLPFAFIRASIIKCYFTTSMCKTIFKISYIRAIGPFHFAVSLRLTIFVNITFIFTKFTRWVFYSHAAMLNPTFQCGFIFTCGFSCTDCFAFPVLHASCIACLMFIYNALINFLNSCIHLQNQVF